VTEQEVRYQASRVAQGLAEVWNEDFPDMYPDLTLEHMLGLALAHAVAQGWVEPDPAMAEYLNCAEVLLAGGDSNG